MARPAEKGTECKDCRIEGEGAMLAALRPNLTARVAKRDFIEGRNRACRSSEAGMTSARQHAAAATDAAASRKRSRSARRRVRVYAALAMLATGFATVAPSRAETPTINAGCVTAACLNRDELSRHSIPGHSGATMHRQRSRSVSRHLAAPHDAGDTVAATAALVRQVQFMLFSIGFDPGAIDGVPRRATSNAVRQFEQKFGLPEADLIRDGQISVAFLDRLRGQTSSVMLGPQTQQPAAEAAPPAAPRPVAAAPADLSPLRGQALDPLLGRQTLQPPAAAAGLPAAPGPAAALAPPAPAMVDRFAACPFTAADFLIGGTQYTPDTFLKAGFGGSTASAVVALKAEFKQTRRLALQIGGQASGEVQRQGRVLDYFECRLKIEHASPAKN
jgi:peptidoglycan hydrolase-like protein with peptidoglycan-binding domain